MRGTVKKIVRDRKFGFIEAENGKDVYFHASALVDVTFDELEERNAVEFEIKSGQGGRSQAADIRRVGKLEGWWTE